MSKVSDKQLMFQVRDGNLDKLGVLFERYNKALYNFFLRLTSNPSASEDLVQDVFFRMLKYKHTYRGDSEFTVWMYRIARNARVDYLKKQSTQQEEISESIKSGEMNPGEKYEQNQDVELIHAALAKIPDEDREVLVLSRFENIKYKDIAEIIGCMEGTIKARVFRAIQRLREAYFELAGENL